MSIIQISSQPSVSRVPLFNLGFRPFFLGAGLYGILSVFVWLLVYVFDFQLRLGAVSPFQWHAHEMVYGYSMAVIAGFLLTAVRNWTGIQTLFGVPLFLLFSLWLVARLLFISGMTVPAGVVDVLFGIGLSISLSLPLIRAKQWMQLAVISKIFGLVVGNAVFYLGALGLFDGGLSIGIYAGLYLVIGLILMLGRRVVPFFIERGVSESVTLHNFKVIDLTSLALFLIFFVAELMQTYPSIAGYSALLLGIVNIIRLLGWYTSGIWGKPLLWSLYLALWGISLGFILFFVAYVTDFSKYLAIHALAYGGVGMMTLGMMARVSLGHTGRDIQNPPTAIFIVFLSLLLGTIFRVIFCALFPDQYILWIIIAMICWISSFAIFSYLYFPVLTRSRVDGQFG